MPRPITKDGIRKIRNLGYQFKTYHHSKLGFYIRRIGESNFAYRVDRYGYPMWVSYATILKRMRKGHPPKRKGKTLMKDIAVFSLEELEEASRMIDEMGWG